LKRDRFAMVALVYLALLILAAVFAGVIAHLVGHPPGATYLTQMTDQYGLPKGPNGSFWFGADTLGRDVFVRVIYGARTSLTVALLATTIAVVVGTSLGIVAGYYGGRVDQIISRAADIFLSLPVLLLALGLSSACGSTQSGCLAGTVRPGILLVSYIIGFFTWPYIGRVVRSQVLSLRESEFVEAAVALGRSQPGIMVREILPNCLPVVIVYSTLIMPANILFEAALSFLGVGVPPSIPSWGRMISDASTNFTSAWWTMVFPGVFLFVTVLAINVVGDGLRDAMGFETNRQYVAVSP
jgi:ABC-type dipeptide/oligopeptide/nickel transport system permease subunit